MKRLASFQLLLCCIVLLCCIAPVRAQQVDALQYTARIVFDLTAQKLDGVATIRFRNAGPQPSAEFTLHLRDLAVSGVTGSVAVDSFRQDGGFLIMTFARDIGAGDTVSVTVGYSGKATSEAGTPSWGGCFWGATTFAMGVGFYAPYVSMTRHWLPSNDVPSDKARFDLTFVVPQGYAAAGAGVLVGPAQAADGMEYRWIEDHPTATYLVTYAVARYSVARDTALGIPCEYYVTLGTEAKAKTYFAPIRTALEAYINAFGPYPFDKVGYCLTPIGSMEHQTMVSYAASLYGGSSAGANAIHELAHMWWGDCVTPQDFREAWLSEGFATYGETVYDEYRLGKAAYYQDVRGNIQDYFSVERSEGTFALWDFPRAKPSSNYPNTIYCKGSAVLAMLRHVMGDSAFYRGLRAYGQAHAYGNATTEDFRRQMEQAHGAALDWFFNEWVYKPGYPVWSVYYPAPPQQGPLRLWLSQRSADTAVYPYYEMPLDLQVVTLAGDTLRTILQAHAVSNEAFTFPAIREDSIRSIAIDPLGVVLKKLDWIEVGVGDPPAPPGESFRLEPGYPNPCSASSDRTATIPFELRDESAVRVDVCDILGRVVLIAADRRFDAGRHLLALESDRLRSGLYAIRMRVGDAVSVRPFVVTR